MKDGKLGCGGLIVIILLVFAFLNDFASELGGAFQFFFTMLQICILSILAFWKRSCIWERSILISCEFNLDSFLWMGNGSWKYCLRVYVVYHDCRNPVWKTIL